MKIKILLLVVFTLTLQSVNAISIESDTLKSITFQKKTSLNNLITIEKGDKVKLISKNGEEVKGKVNYISYDGITIGVKKYYFKDLAKIKIIGNDLRKPLLFATGGLIGINLASLVLIFLGAANVYASGATYILFSNLFAFGMITFFYAFPFLILSALGLFLSFFLTKKIVLNEWKILKK